jgi:CRP-like cAMP-binding protein
VIIREGDEANILVDGIPVNELSEDEVFSAIAILTGEKRSATVIALTVYTSGVFLRTNLLT